MTCPVCGRVYEIRRGHIAAHGAERAEHQRDPRSMLCVGSTTRAPAGPLFAEHP